MSLTGEMEHFASFAEQLSFTFRTRTLKKFVMNPRGEKELMGLYEYTVSEDGPGAV